MEIINEHYKVVEKIRDTFSTTYNVRANLGDEKHYIGQMFPDLILLDKKENKPVFIIEVKKNGNIAPCIQQWKNAISIPGTLYLIVPESDLATAKSIAQVIGLRNRFGFYTINDDGLIDITYE